jgi:hypothetical protein
VTDAAFKNPLRELLAMSALSFSSPLDVTQVPTNPNTLQEQQPIVYWRLNTRRHPWSQDLLWSPRASSKLA